MTATLRNTHELSLREFAAFAAGGDDVGRHRGRWADFFRDRLGPAFAGRVVLEVGSADAAFLCDVAARHPGVGFVGLDWKFKSTLVGAERVAAAGLRNVALLRGRAQDLPRIYAPGEVDEVWVFHPEPCVEPNQRANRLVAEPFLTAVHLLLREPSPPGDGAAPLLAVKTDHAGYFQWVLGLTGTPEPAGFRAAREAVAAAAAMATAVIRPRPSGLPRVRARDLLRTEDVSPANDEVRARFSVPFASADFWHDAAALAHTADRCFAGATTGFEARFVAKRRPIYYVELRKR